MSYELVTVTFRIDRSGQAVPADEPTPPDYIPWPHAPLEFRRPEADYGPGYVRPRDKVTARADEEGRGEVYLAPGRYVVILPSSGVRRIDRHRGTYEVTLSPGIGTIDLSALLAGGGVEPDDPQYPTLAAYVVDQIGVALDDQLDAIDEAVETAGESATTAQAARDAAVSAQTVTEAARDAAIAAQGLAEGARDAAEGYATTAGTARDQAVAAQGAAESAASAASSHASAAAGSASAAQGSATDAAGAASAAAGSASAAEAAREGAETARTQAQGYATTAGEHATQTGLDAAATAADRLAVSQDRQAIESEQAARLAAIQTAGDTQVGRVEDEGTAQVALVTGAGAGRLVQADAVLGLSDLIAWDTLKGSGPLTGSVAPSGQVWQSTASQLERTELGLQQFVGGSQDHWLDIGTADVMVSLDVATRTPARQMLLLRYQDEANYLSVDRTVTSLRLQATVGGTATQLLSVPDFGTAALPAWLRIRVALAHDVIRIWVDDQYLDRGTLTAPQMAAIGAATRFGIRHNNTIGVCYRNLAARRIAL